MAAGAASGRGVRLVDARHGRPSSCAAKSAAERILGLRAELLTLEGLLAICSYLKRIRDEDGAWIPLDRYVETRSQARFSHGVCPGCYEEYLRPQVDG